MGKSVSQTFVECKVKYASFPASKKQPALDLLKKTLDKDRKHVQSMYKKDPEGWWAPFHLSTGMALRNLLRSKGFGEGYWPVDNLDDIYVFLIEEALDLRK